MRRACRAGFGRAASARTDWRAPAHSPRTVLLGYENTTGHLCVASYKRKTRQSCRTCGHAGKARVVLLDERGKPIDSRNKHYRQATPHEKGAAVDMYFDGVSHRKTAQNMEQYLGARLVPPAFTDGFAN